MYNYYTYIFLFRQCRSVGQISVGCSKDMYGYTDSLHRRGRKEGTVNPGKINNARGL